MKRLWLVVALVALGGLTSKTYADVQNIRLSGDIRIRGYFLDDTSQDQAVDGGKGNESFISQRTRVSVEADLEDHVLVVVTLQAEGEWGSDNSTSGSTGAGTGQATPNKLARGFDLGVSEAYLQLNEVFYTPATLKIGRQFLNYGHGLILSSVEQEYNYDAARLVLDYYPLTIDLVGAELANHTPFGPGSTHAGGADLLFVNARYEMTDSVIKNVEAYFGWLSQATGGTITSTRIPPSIAGASPWIIGARTDIQPASGFQIWAEGTYEGGADGVPADKNISAGLLNLGGRFTMKDSQWSPALNANYIFATGGGNATSPDNSSFRPWFDYADGYNGYLFCPALSNIQIFNVGASVKPYENTTLSLQGYYYMKADSDTVAGSNGNVDFGGLASAATGGSSGIGWEFDGIVGYDYSKDVRLQLVYGAFVPGGAYEKATVGFSATAQEVRGEVNVKF